MTWCYTGDPARAEDIFKPIRQWGTPLMDFVGMLPLPALQSMFDPLLAAGMQVYWRNDFVKEVSDEAIALHLKYAAQLPTVLSAMHLYPINGAAHRIGRNDTAWSYRDANFVQMITPIDPDPTNNSRMTQWAKEYWEALHPYSAGGSYLNMIMDENQDRVKAAFRDNYQRLAQIKAKYDLDNLFHVNQNIKPWT